MTGNCIVIVHPDATARRTMRRFLFSDTGDILLREAASAGEALALLAEEPARLVVLHHAPGDMTPEAFLAAAHGNIEIGEIPVLLLAPGSPELERWRKAGFEHILVLPFSAMDLVSHVNAVCDPRNNRIYERVHIPGSRVEILLGGQTREADVINLGLGGLLCILDYFEGFSELCGCAMLTVRLPGADEEISIKAWSDFLRMDIVRSGADLVPEKIRMAWSFLTVEEPDMKTLKRVVRSGVDELDLLRVET